MRVESVPTYMNEHISVWGHTSMVTDRTGLLIIRAWIEEGSSEPLRAHIRISDDVAEGFRRTLTLSRPEAVCAEVKEWLAQILHNAQLPPERDGEQP